MSPSPSPASPSPAPPSPASPSLAFLLLLALILTLSFPVIPKSIILYLIILIAFVLVLYFPLRLSLPEPYSAIIRFKMLLIGFRTFPFLLAALHYLDLLSEAVLISPPSIILSLLILTLLFPIMS